MFDAGAVIRRSRELAGLSQRELGHRAGVTQPVVSAYEGGRRAPSMAVFVRLVEASGSVLVIDVQAPPRGRTLGLPDTPLGRRLRRRRQAVIGAAAARGFTNLRVFGSVARGEDTEASDVDLLVDLAGRASLLDLSAAAREVGALIGAPVDLVPASGLKPHLRDEVLREAIPL